MPSSLERVISRPLVFSTHPPVSVYSTGIFYLRQCELFLEAWHQLLLCRSISYSRLSSKYFLYFSTPKRLNRKPKPGQHSLLRPSLSIKNSTGILTRYPSTTLFSLALGPDLPSADEPSEGNLRFTGHWILTNVFATQADILTSASSTSTYVNASI